MWYRNIHLGPSPFFIYFTSVRPTLQEELSANMGVRNTLKISMIRNWACWKVGVKHRYKREIPDLVYRPCNFVVSHWAQIGGLRVYADQIHKNKRKTNASMIFARRAAFYAYLSSRSDRSRYWRSDDSRLFWLLEKPEDPQFEPMPGSKWRRFWDLLCIFYGVNPEILKNRERRNF